MGEAQKPNGEEPPLKPVGFTVVDSDGSSFDGITVIGAQAFDIQNSHNNSFKNVLNVLPPTPDQVHAESTASGAEPPAIESPDRNQMRWQLKLALWTAALACVGTVTGYWATTGVHDILASHPAASAGHGVTIDGGKISHTQVGVLVRGNGTVAVKNVDIDHSDTGVEVQAVPSAGAPNKAP